MQITYIHIYIEGEVNFASFWCGTLLEKMYFRLMIGRLGSWPTEVWLGWSRCLSEARFVVFVLDMTSFLWFQPPDFPRLWIWDKLWRGDTVVVQRGSTFLTYSREALLFSFFLCICIRHVCFELALAATVYCFLSETEQLIFYHTVLFDESKYSVPIPPKKTLCPFHKLRCFLIVHCRAAQH